MHPYKSGLDFGFTNDPTAYVRFSRRGSQILVTHGFYEYGLTNTDIARRILAITPNIHTDRRFEIVRCDAAEPKSIFDLIQHNVNAVAAMKGPGSVNYGIQHLQQFEIIIDRPLQWLVNEFQLYQWQKNKDGETLNIPIDKDNHGIDALRYGESDSLYDTGTGEPIDPNKAGIYVGR
ncbi:MAG: terminase large subunit, partial [bacterium]|jgi:phage terminase large subunit|nr:terminase large subunit [bacterium]